MIGKNVRRARQITLLRTLRTGEGNDSQKQRRKWESTPSRTQVPDIPQHSIHNKRKEAGTGIIVGE